MQCSHRQSGATSPRTGRDCVFSSSAKQMTRCTISAPISISISIPRVLMDINDGSGRLINTRQQNHHDVREEEQQQRQHRQHLRKHQRARQKEIIITLHLDANLWSDEWAVWRRSGRPRTSTGPSLGTWWLWPTFSLFTRNDEASSHLGYQRS